MHEAHSQTQPKCVSSGWYSRGTAETILGYYGRNRADNVAQFGFAALSPLLYGNSGSSTDETGQGYVGV